MASAPASLGAVGFSRMQWHVRNRLPFVGRGRPQGPGGNDSHGSDASHDDVTTHDDAPASDATNRDDRTNLDGTGATDNGGGNTRDGISIVDVSSDGAVSDRAGGADTIVDAASIDTSKDAGTDARTEFQLAAGPPFASIFATPGTPLSTPTQDQESKGEGVTYAADGVGYFTASELDGKSSRSVFRILCQ